MNIFSICGLVIVCIFLTSLLKEYKSEYRIFLIIACAIVVFIVGIKVLMPIKENIDNLFSLSETSADLLKILYKTLGITYITGLTSDICVDAGEKTLSNNVQLAGKIAIVYVAMPLINETVKIIGSLTSL